MRTTAKGCSIQKTPLILVHGFLQTSHGWDGLDGLWNDSQPVIKLRWPEDGSAHQGFGFEAGIAAIDHELQALREKFPELAPPILVGYSMGGRLILAWLIEKLAALTEEQSGLGRDEMAEPKLRGLSNMTLELGISGIILESSGLGPATAEERQQFLDRDDQLAYRMITEGIEGFVDYWERLPLFETQKLLDPSVRERLRKERLSIDPHEASQWVRAMSQGNMPAREKVLEGLNRAVLSGLPILYLAGLKDEKYSTLASYLSSEVPGIKTHLLPAGHNCHLETPEKFISAVYEFLV